MRSAKSIYYDIAVHAYEAVNALLPTVRVLNFHGNDYDDNRLCFMLLNIAMIEGYHRADERAPRGEAKPLPLGGNGWVFGYDNDYTNHHFHGVNMSNSREDGAARLAVINYRAVETCQRLSTAGYTQKSEAMWDAILSEPVDKRNKEVASLIEDNIVLL